MTAASIRACAVIPSHNHWQAMPAIVERLRALGLAVFVIDDGSEPPARMALAALDAPGARRAGDTPSTSIAAKAPPSSQASGLPARRASATASKSTPTASTT